jgi:AraC-like DNA-binding protein
VASSDRPHEHRYTVANEVVRAPGWLQARWTDSTLTVVAIAMLAGCSDRHVRNVARDLGLPPRRRGGWRTRKPKPEPKPPSRYTQLNNPTWLREQYIFERRPLLAIAREVGCDRSAVRSALRRHGVT